MNCETIKEMLWAYLEKETTAEEAEMIEAHLATCEACRAELEVQKEIMDSLQSIPDEELPDGFHAELMQKLSVEAAPNVVPFPQKAAQKKKKQPMYKQWGMIAAAVLVVVAAGGMNGMLEMRESQNAAVAEMKAMDVAETAEYSVDDLAVAEEVGDAELQTKTTQKLKTMNVPAAGAETANVTSSEVTVYDMDDAAAVPEVASMDTIEEESMKFSIARTAEIQATDRAVLEVTDLAVATAELQKAIAEAGGFEEAAEEGSMFAVIPVENYDGFVEAVENLGTLEWTQKGKAEEGAAFRTVEIKLNMQ